MGISHVRKAADQPGNLIPDWDVSWELIPNISWVWEPTTDIPGPRERVKLINQAWDGWGGEFSPYALYNYPHALVFYCKGFTKLISAGDTRGGQTLSTPGWRITTRSTNGVGVRTLGWTWGYPPAGTHPGLFVDHSRVSTTSSTAGRSSGACVQQR